jgi:hypothetical protein
LNCLQCAPCNSGSCSAWRSTARQHHGPTNRCLIWFATGFLLPSPRGINPAARLSERLRGAILDLASRQSAFLPSSRRGRIGRMDEPSKCPMSGESIGYSTGRCLACGEAFAIPDERDPGACLRIASLSFALAEIIWAFAVDSDPLGRAGAGALVGIALSAFVVSRLALTSRCIGTGLVR